jgi:hypothetical protein
MKIILTSVFILFFVGIANCQFDMQWHIGACTNIDFKTGSAIITGSSDTIDGYIGSNISLCTKDSNLLFFSNGAVIYRADGSIMPGGDTLTTTHYSIDRYPFSTPFSQGSLIINKPGSDSLYYLIQEAVDNDSLANITSNIYLITIDISADSGQGEVISKGNLYTSTDTLMSGKLQAVRHANGRDWWIISKKGNSNDLLEWLFTVNTIIGPSVIAFGGPVGQNSVYAQACFSEDGNHYALINWNETLSYFQFDRCTGVFNPIFNNDFNDSFGPGCGVAFSYNNRFMYATTSQYCYQFDLTSSNIWSSRVIVGNWDGFNIGGILYDFQRMSLAPDHKIYISPGSTNYIWSVINSPDSLDSLCNFQQHSIQLFCYNNVAFPNIPNFNLGPVPFSQCDTINGINYLESDNLTIYPNPCSDYVKINLSKNAMRYNTLRVYNSLTQFVLQRKINPEQIDLSIDVSWLPKGVYFVLLENERGALRRSFL